MGYPLFRLEEFFAQHEFSARFLLCSSDAETISLAALLQMADTECMRLWDELQLHYAEVAGHPMLRHEISNRYADTIDKDSVLCFVGAEEAIYCAIHAVLEPADHAIVITPCYQSLETLSASICEVSSVTLRYEERWELDLERIKQARRENTKLIIINFPHNPTGAMISRDKQAELVEFARMHGIWILSDEVYHLLEIEETDRLPPIADVYERGLSLNVLSKVYGLGGVRVGWLASVDHAVLQHAQRLKHYLSISNSAPSEILAVIALRAEAQLIARNRSLIHENIQRLDRFFSRHADWFEWIRPRGGCIGYPLFRSSKKVQELTDDVLQKTGVLLLPATIYNDTANHFRIGFGRKNMPEALQLFERYIEDNQANWSKGPHRFGK